MVQFLLQMYLVKVYFELYKTILNFQQNYYLYCECDAYPGCKNEYFQRNNCLICQFYYNFSIEDVLEPAKFKTTKLFELNEKIQKELGEPKKICLL